MSNFFYEDLICQSTRKIDGKQCTHKAYYSKDGKIYCGVHSKKYSKTNNRILLKNCDGSSRRSTRNGTPEATTPLLSNTSFFKSSTKLTDRPQFICTPTVIISKPIVEQLTYTRVMNTYRLVSFYSVLILFLMMFVLNMCGTYYVNDKIHRQSINFFTHITNFINEWIKCDPIYNFKYFSRGHTIYPNISYPNIQSFIGPLSNSFKRDA